MSMDHIEYDGIWWHSPEPDHAWPGTVRFDRRQGTVLTVRVDNQKPEPFGPLREYELIHGVASNGIPITLINCFDRLSQGSSFTTSRRLEIYANEMIAGLHCDSADPMLSVVTVRFAHMNEWWGQSGFENDPSVKLPDFAARYKTKRPLVLSEGPFRVSIKPYAIGSFSARQVLIKEQIVFEIESAEPRRLSEFQRITKMCNDFLSVACSALCEIEEFSVVPPRLEGDRPRMGTLHAVPFLKNRERRKSSSAKMLFTFSDIAARPQTLFAEWLNKTDKLEDARTLYMVGLYGGGYVEHRLLALTQAAEAYHRRFLHDRYMNDAQFETDVLAPLNAAVTSNIDPSHRAAILARLKFANEFSLRRRFRDLFRLHSDTLSILVDEPADYESPIIAMRNEFTHFPVPASGARVARANRDAAFLFIWILRLLLEACFLTEMGFTRDEVVGLMRRSDVYRQMSRRFRGTS